MNDQSAIFKATFNNACVKFSEEYRELRQQLLALPDEALTLDENAYTEDWKKRLQAQILKGWLKTPDAYKQIRLLADGTDASLEGEKYLSGKPPIDKAVSAIQAYGKAFAPALLEIIYKEPDVLTEYNFTVCGNTLLLWNYKPAIPVFREILMDRGLDVSFRDGAILPLVELKAEGLYGDFTAVFEDEKTPTDLRATALSSLGLVEDTKTIPYLKHLFEGNDPVWIRASAAEGLGETGKVEVIDLLTKHYKADLPDELKESIINSLIDFDEPEAVESLKHIRSIETDAGFQEMIDEELENF